MRVVWLFRFCTLRHGGELQPSLVGLVCGRRYGGSQGTDFFRHLYDTDEICLIVAIVAFTAAQDKNLARVFFTCRFLTQFLLILLLPSKSPFSVAASMLQVALARCLISMVVAGFAPELASQLGAVFSRWNESL